MSGHITIVAVIAAYNEEDIIGQVVRALIEDGVQVYFIDHRSTDRTVDEVRRYFGRGVIGIETFPNDSGDADAMAGAFTWEDILRRKEVLTRTLKADWFIHHDADEFRESPWPGLTLSEAVGRVDALGYNAIDFHVLNFWPTEGQPDDSGDVRETIRFCEPAQPWDRRQVKCWKNTGQPVDSASAGGHEAVFAGRRVFPIRFLLRHYPIRSQAHGERKVFQERVGRFVPAERQRGWHVQYDRFHKGASFVRDPALLVRYDPEAVRLDLELRHRDVERLEQVLADGQHAQDQMRDRLDVLLRQANEQNRETVQLRVHLGAQDEELGRLRPSVAAQEAQLDELRRHLRAQDEELGRLRPCVVAQETQLNELRRHLGAQDEELAHLRPAVMVQAAQLDELGRHLGVRDEELGRFRSEREKHVQAIEEAQQALETSQQRLADILTSRSWRITAPLRVAQRVLSGK